MRSGVQNAGRDGRGQYYCQECCCNQVISHKVLSIYLKMLTEPISRVEEVQSEERVSGRNLKWNGYSVGVWWPIGSTATARGQLCGGQARITRDGARCTTAGRRPESRGEFAGTEPLCFFLDFALRQGGYDCRAGNHGHKCESNQNVVHRRLLQEEFCFRFQDPGNIESRSRVPVTLFFRGAGTQLRITNLHFLMQQSTGKCL